MVVISDTDLRISGGVGQGGSPPGRRIVEEALERGAGALDEARAKALLAEYGMMVTPGALVYDVDEAVRVAQDLGYPVVMKGVSPGILHKSDVGLVLVDVRDEDAVRGGHELLCKRSDGGLEAVLVERMIPSGRELVVGMSRDVQFGPVVMFGLGGVLTEALDDVAFGVAPLSRREAEELLGCIRSSRLLGEFRGEPAVDRDALAHMIITAGQMALDHPEIRELDINPVLMDGDKPIAADALVTIGPPEPGRAPRLSTNLSKLDAVFRPGSAAIVGASNDSSKWGGSLMVNLLSGEFPGDVYPVNPKAESVFGVPAYPSISDLPEAPDVALIAVPAALVAGVMKECGEKGVRAVVVITAGFSEVGEEGAEQEKQLARIASDYDMAMIGPNCMGVMSSWSKFYSTGLMVMHPSVGPGSFLSQSGNMGIQLMASAEMRKGGIGKFVGIGNEALLDSTDLLEYFRSDPETGLILAYIEGFEDGRRFLEFARRTTVEKPVIVLRSGVSEYGRKAAASHTGTMAGSAKVFDAVVRQSGIISTTDPDEFLDLTFSLSYLPRPRGRRVAVVTMGGGWGVLSADEVWRTGLRLAELPEDVIGEIDELLPPFWSGTNPVDLVGASADGIPQKVVETVVRSEAVDAVIVLGVVGLVDVPERMRQVVNVIMRDKRSAAETVLPPESEAQEMEFTYIKRVSELMEEYRKPIINVSFLPVEQAVYETEGRFSPVTLPSPLRSVRVISKMAQYQSFLDAVDGG